MCSFRSERLTYCFSGITIDHAVVRGILDEQCECTNLEVDGVAKSLNKFCSHLNPEAKVSWFKSTFIFCLSFALERKMDASNTLSFRTQLPQKLGENWSPCVMTIVTESKKA